MNTRDITAADRRPSPLADTIGRGLAGLGAIATGGAFVYGSALVMTAGDDRIWVELWRTSAYLVFAGVLTIVALAPRATRGLWELVIAQKLFLTLAFPFVIEANEAAHDGTVDAILVTVLIAAYVLCRGWLAWRPATAAPQRARTASTVTV